MALPLCGGAPRPADGNQRAVSGGVPGLLRQGPRSVALENGRMAQVFYVPAAGAVTEVEVPEGCCQISGDNVEGFILTWWGDTHENG